MSTDDLTESLWLLEGQSVTLTMFEDHLKSCFDSALTASSSFGFTFNTCDPYATTATLVPSTVGEVEEYNDECDNLCPDIQFTRT